MISDSLLISCIIQKSVLLSIYFFANIFDFLFTIQVMLSLTYRFGTESHAACQVLNEGPSRKAWALSSFSPKTSLCRFASSFFLCLCLPVRCFSHFLVHHVKKFA